MMTVIVIIEYIKHPHQIMQGVSAVPGIGHAPAGAHGFSGFPDTANGTCLQALRVSRHFSCIQMHYQSQIGSRSPQSTPQASPLRILRDTDPAPEGRPVCSNLNLNDKKLRQERTVFTIHTDEPDNPIHFIGTPVFPDHLSVRRYCPENSIRCIPR